MEPNEVFSILTDTLGMKEVHHFATISEYNKLAGQETFHPLASVIDFSNVTIPSPEYRSELLRYFSLGFYAVFLKNNKYCEIYYGRNKYDYQEGTLMFIGPDQAVHIEYNNENYIPKGHALLFHPDLLLGTPLTNIMQEYSFFSYQATEALHVSEREKQIVIDCFEKIDLELRQAIDKHSKKLVVSNIELFLNYCVRFYDRQFLTRDVANAGILADFERLLNNYLRSDKASETGLPTVGYFADELHLSANYFGDLIKKGSGQSAQEYIHAKLMEIAKEKLFEPGKSVGEIAYELGFKYPQHFTRLFKQRIGQTPNEYRSALN